MELSRQKKLADSAQTWFDGKFKTIIDENRRRYRMQLSDEMERRKRGLSALPSTKTPAAVDRFVERAIIEYHQDPDSISFTAKASGDTMKDQWAKWLTEDFIYRSRNTFDFFTWHLASLTSCAVDGIECALVYWKRESYSEPALQYHYVQDDGVMMPVPKEVFDQYSEMMPDRFHAMEVPQEQVTADTWWIDQLEPGKDVIWDPQIPLMNVNLGQFCLVRLRKTAESIQSLAQAGILDPTKVTDEILSKYRKQGTSGIIYKLRGDRTLDDPDDVDLGDQNLIELNCFFFKKGSQWLCQFSLEMKDAVSEVRPVNDVWFGGRKVNRLPVVVGTTKPKLWESAGRSIPETIRPIEDEHIDHKNNVNDAAKIAIQGRWEVDPDSDVDIDSVLNGRVRYANQGEVREIQNNFDVFTSIRADDSRIAEMNELLPASMVSGARQIVPKGTNKTLGAAQLSKMESDEKLGVHLMTRNRTFLEPVLWLIAQYTMQFETDDVILRIAGQKAGIQVPQVARGQKTILDLSVLDFDINVQINAGLGSAPRYQKADMTMQLIDWGKTHQVPVKAVEAFRQLSVLAGYDADQLLGEPSPPQPPPVEHKMSLNVTWGELVAADPTIVPFLLQLMKEGQVETNMKVDNPDIQARANLSRQNGGGMMLPDRTGQVVDGTGNEAMGMSAGGMQNAQGMGME